MGLGNIIGSREKAIIDEQMQKSLCKIKINTIIKGTGFFCLIPFPDRCNLLPVIITSSNVLTEHDINIGKTIELLIKNLEESVYINMTVDRKTYTNTKIGITIIEIKQNELNVNNFLEIDDQIYSDKLNNGKKYLFNVLFQRK